MSTDPILRRAGAGRDRAGFSLMEVLIALVVGSILGLALLGVQFQAFKSTQSAKAVWESLNASAEFLARQYPDDLKESTGGEVSWPERANVHFTLVLNDQPERGVRWYDLSMRTAGGVMGWQWPEARIEWRALESSAASALSTDSSQAGAAKDSFGPSGDSFGSSSSFGGGGSFGKGFSK